jgi:CheY-like chemotaxis protein
MVLKNIETYTAARHRFVLVVDSNERNLKFLSSLLKQFEYNAYAVGTVEEALELATVISPVLIVTSRHLDAGNDAAGFIKRFKSVNPTCTAPFIVLTAGADPAFERDCLNAGALTCLRAPVTIENFYRIIQVAIEPVPRMTIRISTNLPAIIGGSRKDELVRDISENGAYVLTSSLHPLKTELPVRIKLADSLVSINAEVIYVRRAEDDRNGQSGMGLQFVRISPDDQQRIRLFIRSELSKGIARVRTAP